MNKRMLAAALLLAGSAPLVPAAQPAGFICGGVGQPEAQAMKARAAGHDLILTFAEAGGAYLADVAFRISDGQGRIVLAGTCEGPIMLADLPAPGTWHVAADVNGIGRQATVATRRGRTARLTLLWPAGD